MTACALCGKEATGHAFVGASRLCHGDEDVSPTCYERVVQESAGPRGGFLSLRGLQAELDELERTDPDVRRAAENYRETVRDIISRSPSRSTDSERGDTQQ